MPGAETWGLWTKDPGPRGASRAALMFVGCLDIICNMLMFESIKHPFLMDHTFLVSVLLLDVDPPTSVRKFGLTIFNNFQLPYVHKCQYLHAFPAGVLPQCSLSGKRGLNQRANLDLGMSDACSQRDYGTTKHSLSQHATGMKGLLGVRISSTFASPDFSGSHKILSLLHKFHKSKYVYCIQRSA